MRLENKVFTNFDRYRNDSDYWRIESLEQRIAQPEFFKKEGYGFKPNQVPAIRYTIETASSFVDPFNSKNHNMDKFLLHPSEIDTWSFEAPEQYATQMIPVFYKDGIFINDSPRSITKLDAITGNVLWRRDDFEGPVGKRGLLIHKDIMYLTQNTKILALDINTGRPANVLGSKNSIDLFDPVIVEPKLWGEKELVLVTANANIYSIEIASGKITHSGKIFTSDEESRAGTLNSTYMNPRVWGGFAADYARGVIYLTTSNPTPTLVGVERPGANEFSSSVVAYSLEAGSVIWDFQDVAHDLWDLDMAAPPVLLTLEKNDKLMDVVVAIGKTGNVYILNRDNGENIHEYLYRRAPTSDIIGEKTSAYQKFTVTPPNLLGEYNTKIFHEGEWLDEFYAPPSTQFEVKLKGLHGGEQWSGFSGNGNYVLTSVSHDMTSIGLIETTPYKTESNSFKSCESCHNGIKQPNISHYIGTRSRTEFEEIIKLGFQAMPSVNLSNRELNDILDYLTKNDNYNGKIDSLRKTYARKPYRKVEIDEQQPAEVIFIDLLKGKILWRNPIDDDEVGISIPSTLIINDSYGVVSGNLSKSLSILDLSSGETVMNIVLENISSVSPLIFRRNDLIFLFVAATGSRTVSLYNDDYVVGGYYKLYEIGKVIYDQR